VKKCFLINFLVFLFSVLLAGTLLAQVSYDDDAEQLITLASHLTTSVALQSLNLGNKELSPDQASDRLKQACLLLEAAGELAPDHPQLWHDLLKIYITDAIDDPLKASLARFRYTNLGPRHFSIHRDWLGYQFNQYNSREEREVFLQRMLAEYESYPDVSSLLYTQYAEMQAAMGLYASDPENQISGAIDLFNRSVQLYRYNTHAISGMLAVPPEEGDVNYQLLDLLLSRQQLQNNPFRLDALLNLIRLLDDAGLYSISQHFYPIAYRHLERMEDKTGLIYELKLNQLFSLYSGEQYAEANALCDELLQSNPTHLVALSLKTKCYEKSENADRHQAALLRAEQAADALWRQWQTDKNPETQILLAWYYCLVSPSPERAIEVTNPVDENASDQDMINFRCYASLLNGNEGQTRILLEGADASEPTIALVWAIMERSQNNDDQALARLDAIARYPKGLVADLIKLEYQQLSQPSETSEETPPFAAFDNEAMRAAAGQLLGSNYDNRDFEIPYDPLKYMHCSIRILSGKDTFTYNDPIMAKIYLTNSGDTSVILGPDNLANPAILIFADIEPLDQVASSFTKPVPQESSSGRNIHLVGYRTLYHRETLPPGESNVITQSLNIGVVRDLLQSYPQKAFRITYTIVLDPLQEDEGSFLGNIPQIQPKPFTVWRKAFKPTQRNMKKLYELSHHGESSDRIETVQLLGGLLRESALADKGQAQYRIHPLKNRDMLRSWISINLTSEDFRVQAWSAFSLRNLPISANGTELKQLTGMLNSPNAFVRFMVAHTLDSVVDLQDYYSWAIKNEESDLLKRLAVWKSGQPWTREPSPYDEFVKTPKEVTESSERDAASGPS
jgi:hypothetical protein